MCEASARVVRMLRTPRVEVPQRCKNTLNNSKVMVRMLC